ncbi:hypothetical protein L7F22_028707 [Adiantum nelumboides]|nr:hypothetical protein [Adiantum nelumboides]
MELSYMMMQQRQFSSTTPALGLASGNARRHVAQHRRGAHESTHDDSSSSFTFSAVDPVGHLLPNDPKTDGGCFKIAMVGAVASIIIVLPSQSSPADAFSELPLEIICEARSCCSVPKLEAHTDSAAKLTGQQRVMQAKPQKARFVSRVPPPLRYVSPSRQPSKRLQTHEPFGESSRMDYEQLIQEHEEGTQKRDMFTGDAWLGMMRLQRYNDLLESLEQQEKLCGECIRNRR